MDRIPKILALMKNFDYDGNGKITEDGMGFFY